MKPPKEKKQSPEKYDQNARHDFPDCFALVTKYLELCARSHIRVLLTVLAASGEFTFSFDAPGAKQFREIAPELFGEKDKISYGKTIYFKYKI